MEDHSFERFRIKINFLSVIAFVLALIGYIVCGIFDVMSWSQVLWSIFETTALIIIISTVIIIVYAEVFNGYYRCKHCGHLFRPSLKQHFFGIHFFSNRRLRCPRCQKKDWCKKIWDNNVKEEDFYEDEDDEEEND